MEGEQGNRSNVKSTLSRSFPSIVCWIECPNASSVLGHFASRRESPIAFEITTRISFRLFITTMAFHHGTEKEFKEGPANSKAFVQSCPAMMRSSKEEDYTLHKLVYPQMGYLLILYVVKKALRSKGKPKESNTVVFSLLRHVPLFSA